MVPECFIMLLLLWVYNSEGAPQQTLSSKSRDSIRKPAGSQNPRWGGALPFANGREEWFSANNPRPHVRRRKPALKERPHSTDSKHSSCQPVVIIIPSYNPTQNSPSNTTTESTNSAQRDPSSASTPPSSVNSAQPLASGVTTAPCPCDPFNKVVPTTVADNSTVNFLEVLMEFFKAIEHIPRHQATAENHVNVTICAPYASVVERTYTSE